MYQKASIKVVLFIGLLLVLAGALAYFLLVQKPSPVEQVQINQDDTHVSTLSAAKQVVSVPAKSNNTVQASDATSVFLTFSSPYAGQQLSAKKRAIVSWTIAPDLKTKFKDFYIVLTLVDSTGVRVGAIGDGYHMSQTSNDWNIPSYVSGGFYYPGLIPGEHYAIRAMLQIDSTLSLGCDPTNPNGPKDCTLLYSDANKALIKEAQGYTSESGSFTFGDL
ncbi:hypothetical protein HY968_00075 [Candidatus Kaiserbacteria bacterium]|nr:hypothetical protein [Candidatus Kaiserbacteria bacterium]